MNAATLFALAAVAATASGLVVKVYEVDDPSPATMAQKEYKDCSSLYRVRLSAVHTSQGNDLGHSLVHGKDTSYGVGKELHNAIEENFMGEYGNLAQIGSNQVNEPRSNDPVAQARARALQSVTALTEEGATPLGFFESRLHMYYGVCVEVVDVAADASRQTSGTNPAGSLGGRWVEVMAETMIKNQQICVKDMHEDTHEDPAVSECGMGELYQCREADIKMQGQPFSYPATGSVTDRSTGRAGEGTMLLKFFCRENCDDPDYKFRWRIAAQQVQPRLDNGRWFQKDGEDWCATRKGDDYPSSLLAPYPKGYSEPTIFDQVSSAAAATASAAALVAVALAALF